MSYERVRLGIVGLGGWARQICAAVECISEAEVVGCYSRYAETRRSFASEYGCVAYEQYDAMLDDERIEGVVVTSANAAHADDVLRAAAKGKHVYVTKPIATTLFDSRRMVETCSAHGVVLAVGHQTRREPALRELKRVLDNRELGEVRLVEANYSTPNGMKIGKEDWRWSEQECPGGVLAQIGIHVIDSLRYLLGPIKSVYSRLGRGGLSAEITGVATTLLEFESGLPGYLGASYASSFSHWITIYGSERNAHFNQLGGLVLSEDSWSKGEVRKKLSPPSRVTAPMPAVIEEMEEFVRCIRTGDSPEVGGDEASHNLAVVLAAVESSRSGRPVEIAALLGEVGRPR